MGGDQPRWEPVSDNCAEDGDGKGWVLDVQNLYPLSLKATGSDKSSQSTIDLSTQIYKYSHFH